MSAVEQPEPRPRPERQRGLWADQMIRSHSMRAAATYLATVDGATDDDLFALAKRIANFIEGPRRDGR